MQPQLITGQIKTGNEKQRELIRMRAIATSLLGAMAILFLVTTLFQAAYGWLGYVRAFAEAAMVGALADWFAVTALFRRPLGLPIPHTEVVPRSKDRIGESLGRFVEDHFLPADVIRTRLDEVDFAALLAGWLASSQNALSLSKGLTAVFPDLLHAFDDETVRKWLGVKVREQLESVGIASLAGDILAAVTANNRHQALLDGALRQAASVIAEKEPQIRQKVRDSTGWLWQKLSVDERAFNGIMTAIEDLVREVEEDPGHELRRRFDDAVRSFISKLKESPEYGEKAEAIKREVLESPVLQGYLAEVWDDVRRRIVSDLEASDSEIRLRLGQALVHVGENLLADAGLRATLNRWLRDNIAVLVDSRRREVARLIPDTVRTWDAATMAERMELQVGKDLQFIRINGTLVGGLVGVAIYTLSQLLH